MSNETTPSPRVARKRARARDRILDATCEVLRRIGHLKVTMDDIALEADVSKAALYYYFPSREAVFRALGLRSSLEAIELIVDAIDAAPSGGAVVDAVVEAYVRYYLDALHLFRTEFVWSQTVGPDGGGDEVDAAMVGLFDRLESRLAEDAERGLIHQDVTLRRTAVAVWTAAHGTVSTLSALDHEGSRLLHDVHDLIREQCGILRRGIYR